MVERVVITDEKSARAWLETQPHQVRVWFATRCALRALPRLGVRKDSTTRGLAFVTCRATLISAATVTCPAAEIKELKKAANSAAISVHYAAAALSTALTVRSAALSVALAANSAAESVALSVRPAAESANRSFALSIDRPTVHSAASTDTSAPLTWSPIWPDRQIPNAYAQTWTALKAQWKLDAADWSFWIEWYEAILNGTPLPWQLTQRIALKLTEDEWEGGQAVVGPRIDEIRDRWLAEQLPQAENLIEDPATGRFDVRTVPIEKHNLIENILSQMEFSLSLAVDSNSSDFNRMCTAFKYLDHTLTNCRDDPNAIEQNLGLAKGIIENNLSDLNYRADDGLRALAQSLEQHQLQIRADHPEVRKAWEKRIAQRIREVDRDTKLKAVEAIRAEQSRVQGRLSIETDLDAETVETDQTAEVQATAIRRATGRSARMNTLQRVSQTAKDIDASGGYKATRIGTTGYTLVDIVMKFLGG